MVSRSAICTMTGAIWLAFRVWPSREVCVTTVPVIGRVNLGVAQVGLVAAERGAGLLDLRAEGLDRRLGHAHVGLALFELLLADGLLGDQAAIALEDEAVVLQLRLLLGKLRGQRGDARLVAGHAGGVDARVDFGDQLAFVDHVADGDVQAAELSGHLRAHVDVGLGFQLALGGDRFGQVLARHRLEGKTGRQCGRRVALPQRQSGARQCQQDDGGYPTLSHVCKPCVFHVIAAAPVP